MVRKAGLIDWDDLRFFLRAAQTGTLAGAARALAVEHTTIGRRLDALERALGAPLVMRGPEGLRLTPLGTRVLPHVEEIDRAARAIVEQAAADRRRVRLAVPSGFAALITAELPRLTRAHADVSLELLSGSRPVDIKHGEADIALRVGPVTDPDLVAQKVGTMGWALYAAHAYVERRGAPADLDDLSGHDIIGYDASLASVPGALWLEARAAGTTVVLHSRELSDMLAAAKAGLGLAALPCLLGEGDPVLLRLTKDVIGSRSLALVYRRAMLRVAPVRAVIRFVTELMRERAATISGERGDGAVGR
jgi:DNA-binding transcriptional LysR family regulator